MERLTILRTLVLACCIALAWLSILATAGPRYQSIAMAADGQQDQGKSSYRSGPLESVRDAVKPLEISIVEEPPKAIKNTKEGFLKRFNKTQGQSKEK